MKIFIPDLNNYSLNRDYIRVIRIKIFILDYISVCILCARLMILKLLFSLNQTTMKSQPYFKVYLNLLFTSLVLLASCASVALYDDYSFKQTINAKVETIDLMKKSVDAYDQHAQEVNDLMDSLQKIYDYDKRRTNNELSTKMWNVLMDDQQFLVAGYFKKWKEGGPQNQAFVNEAIKQITEAFDILLDFEGAKDKARQNQVGAIINSFVSNL